MARLHKRVIEAIEHCDAMVEFYDKLFSLTGQRWAYDRACGYEAACARLCVLDSETRTEEVM